MKNNKEEILKKAIKKAIKNGWKRGDTIIECIDKKMSYNIEAVTRNLFFSHDFAKAFWGEKEIRTMIDFSYAEQKKVKYEVCWKHHLQQMVLEKDPLEYIAKFL